MTGDYQQPPSQSSTMAVISLISGIVTWFGAPIVGALVAVITGHLAKKEITESKGRLTGESMATAGLILGYIQLGITVLGSCVVLILIALGIMTPFLCLPFANIFGALVLPLLGI